MSKVGIVLLVFFVIVCVLLVLLVAIQDDGESGMGGLLGGRGTAAFGSHSASVLTKATTVLVVLFFVLALALALVTKPKKVQADITDKSVVTTTESTEPAAEAAGSTWWVEADAADEKTVVADEIVLDTAEEVTEDAEELEEVAAE